MRLIAFFCLAIFLCFSNQVVANEISLKIAVSPFVDSIIIRVADGKGFFEQNGLSVQVIPFQSVEEVGAAMRAGTVDGHSSSIIDILIQNETGAPQSIIFGTAHTVKEQRSFGLAVGPNSKARSLADMENFEIAISTSTIIEFLLVKLLEEQGFTEDYLIFTEVSSVPLRLQMLLSGQVESALLSEPSLTFLEVSGGHTILDDTNIIESMSVVALNNKFLQGEEGKSLYRKFTQALLQASEYINANPDSIRKNMIERGLLNPEAQEKYDVLRFDMQNRDMNKPSEVIVESYIEWMLEQGILNKAPEYSEIVFHE